MNQIIVSPRAHIIYYWMSFRLCFFSLRPSGVYLREMSVMTVAWRMNGQGVGLLEELLDKINVGHDHTAAAVALQAELIHGISG